MQLAKRVTIFLITFLLLCAGANAQAATKMPHFALPSAEDGSLVDSESYKGQVMLINFWATWCPPCRKEIPSLIKLQNEFGSKGFTVIGLSTDQGGSKVVVKLMKKMGVNYPILMADSKTPRAFGGILGIPTSFLVNKKGYVVKRYDGYVDHNTLLRDLKSVIE